VLRAHRLRGGIVVAATHVPLPLDDVMELRLG
jgi:ABC-type transport system involved in cytochrome c biogenesis ATPase subunit